MSNSATRTVGPTVATTIHQKGLTIGVFTQFGVYAENKSGDADNGGNPLIPIAPNLLAPYQAKISCILSSTKKNADPGMNIEISLRLNPSVPRYDVWKYTLTSYLGEPVSMAAINRVPLDIIMHANMPFLYSADSTGKAFGPINWSQICREIQFASLRENHTTAEVLAWAYRIYAVASLKGGPPTKTVAETFGVPLRTASYWVKKAKTAFANQSPKHNMSIPPSSKAFDFRLEYPEINEATQRFLDLTSKKEVH